MNVCRTRWPDKFASSERTSTNPMSRPIASAPTQPGTGPSMTSRQVALIAKSANSSPESVMMLSGLATVASRRCRQDVPCTRMCNCSKPGRVLSPGPGSEESRYRTHANNVRCWGFGDSGWSDIISLGFSSLPFHTISSHALQDQLSLIRQTFFHEHSSDAGSGRAGPVDSSATARAQKAFAVSRLESRNKISMPKPHALNPKNL